MLKIKTILIPTKYASQFDEEVNNFLADGWELVRRDVLPPYVCSQDNRVDMWQQMLYAELEREVEPEEEEEPEDEDDGTAFWVFSRRDPIYPYKCSACGCTPDPDKTLPDRCPACHREMKKGR